MLRKVISGGQTGADIAGLVTAKRFGIPTGGHMPFGYKTSDGPKPEYKELYGVSAHSSSSYVPRTRANVKNSDGTIRLAVDFQSAGEICTRKAIDDYNKPHFDFDLNNDPEKELAEAVKWVEENDILVLNVAGNRERGNIEEKTSIFLALLFEELGHREVWDGSSKPGEEIHESEMPEDE